jgi:hypothetical protein
VTIHDTAADGTASFSVNAKAKEKHATPFERPENGVFRPGTQFSDFFFTETADTNAATQAGEEFGGFGALMKLTQRRPSDDTGTLEPFFVGDVLHTGLDNIAFLSTDSLIAVEDAGETLHQQRDALDSMWLFDVNASYGGSDVPVRVLAQGRDASATVDAGLLAIPNNGNEITGLHVSDGDPTELHGTALSEAAAKVGREASPNGLSRGRRATWRTQVWRRAVCDSLPFGASYFCAETASRCRRPRSPYGRFVLGSVSLPRGAQGGKQLLGRGASCNRRRRRRLVYRSKVRGRGSARAVNTFRLRDSPHAPRTGQGASWAS